MTTLLKIENVSKVYKTKHRTLKANDDITFDLNEAEILTILGHNGAGKTTLLKQIMGFILPDSGNITLHLKQMPNRNSKNYIGYMNQSRSSAIAHLNIDEAFYLTARIKGLAQQDTYSETNKLLDQLQLANKKRIMIKKLSDGEQQLVELGLALLGKPKILILDEPTAQIDPEKRRLIWDILMELNKVDRVSIILVTHNLLEADRLSNRILIMKNGQVIMEGFPHELKRLFGNKWYLNVTISDGLQPGSRVLNDLYSLGQVKSLGLNKYLIIVNNEEIDQAFAILRSDSMRTYIEEFSLGMTPLDDIYLDIINHDSND